MNGILTDVATTFRIIRRAWKNLSISANIVYSMYASVTKWEGIALEGVNFSPGSNS